MHTLKKRAWLVYAGLVAVAGTAYFLVPQVRHNAILYNAIGLSTVVAIVLGLRLWRPATPAAWWLFAAGQVLFVLGDVVAYSYEHFFHAELPFPSVADPLYLAVYPVWTLGLLLLIRRRGGGDRAGLIDSLIITGGVGLLTWVFLMAPYVQDPGLSVVRKLVSIAYPLMDVLLLAVAVRLAVGSGRREMSFYLPILAIVTLFATDSIYGWIQLHGNYRTGDILDSGWILSYLLWGAAALHPSMRSLDRGSAERLVKPYRYRLVLLAAASSLAPAVQLFVRIRGDHSQEVVLAGGSLVLFVLVVLRLGGLMVDINHYRRTERQLRETEAKYRGLVEGIPGAVYVAGLDGKWLYVSPQIETLLGIPAQALMAGGHLWPDRVHPDDRSRVAAERERAAFGVRSEYRLLAGDGRVVWVGEEAVVLRDEAGVPIVLQGVLSDISERKLAEEALRDALERETEAANHLRALDEMKNHFLEALSHDLRTPLTSIMGLALTLERAGARMPRQEILDLIPRIAVNARKLNRLLADLLDLDRLSRGIIEPNRRETDLAELARTVLAECDLGGHEVVVDPDGPTVEIDVGQVGRVIENLVMNAVRYTPPDTPIWVRFEPPPDSTEPADDGGVVLIVEDAGPGVPDEIREQIFEPFRRGQEFIAHDPGIGIGLALVSRFAALHGGRAWVEDRPGGGASFQVFLAPAPQPSDAILAGR